MSYLLGRSILLGVDRPLLDVITLRHRDGRFLIRRRRVHGGNHRSEHSEQIRKRSSVTLARSDDFQVGAK